MAYRIIGFVLFVVIVYAVVLKARAGRTRRRLEDLMRLVKAQGSVELIDVCRALALRPAVAEELLAALVERGHLATEHTPSGAVRYREAELIPQADDTGMLQ